MNPNCYIVCRNCGAAAERRLQFATARPETQQHLLRIAQEAINNAVRHANPTTISVSLQCDRSYLELQIQDNGRGISGAELLSQGGFGLTNMQNRAKKIGATLDIRTGVGGGTAIAVRLPINA